MYKQVILVRQDLKMDKGKMAVQVAHASVEAVLKSDRKLVLAWKEEGMKKAVLKVQGIGELLKCKREGEAARLKTALITDSARTFFSEPTTTCLAIGPDEEEAIDKVTGKLKIL